MKKAINLLLLAALVFGAYGIYGMTNAQTYPALTCNVGSSSVSPNQSVTLTASGGTGTYSWSGAGVTGTTSTGTTFSPSFPSTGTYTVTVTSGTQSANCFVNVTSTSTTPPSSGNLICSPATQAANVGQNVSFTASGGTGSYTWSSPDLTITNPTGSGFSATFGSSGTKAVTVQSGNNAAICIVNVTGTTIPVPPVVPGLPNTGGGYGH